MQASKPLRSCAAALALLREQSASSPPPPLRAVGEQSCAAALTLLREQLLPLLGPPSNTARSPGDLELELLCCVEQMALADAQVGGGTQACCLHAACFPPWTSSERMHAAVLPIDP